MVLNHLITKFYSISNRNKFKNPCNTSCEKWVNLFTEITLPGSYLQNPFLHLRRVPAANGQTCRDVTRPFICYFVNNMHGREGLC